MYKDIKIIYDSAIEEDILQLLKDKEIDKYVKIPKIEGCWSKCMRHLDTHIWPGTDSMLMLIMEKEAALRLIEVIKEFKKDMKYEVPLIAIVSPVEQIV